MPPRVQCSVSGRRPTRWGAGWRETHLGDKSWWLQYSPARDQAPSEKATDSSATYTPSGVSPTWVRGKAGLGRSSGSPFSSELEHPQVSDCQRCTEHAAHIPRRRRRA